MSRPRSIPEKEAIERALRLFWEKGYNRTSIADLSEVVGVGPSSIYNAFGSKLQMFEKCIQHYMSTHVGFVEDQFTNSSNLETSEFISKLLSSLVLIYTDDETPPGCAMMQAGGSGIASDSQACAVTQVMKSGLESALLGYFEARETEGDSISAQPTILAKFVVGTIRGLSQLATDGSTREDLLDVADLAAKSCSNP